MKLKQLSVFLENQPGRLSDPCRILARAGINIVTLSLADTQQFGILRLLIRQWQQAKAVLEDAGAVVQVADVVALEVADRPGGLAELLVALEQAGINVEYMYAFTCRRGDQAVLVFRFEDPDRAIEILQQQGINAVAPLELFEPAG
jgi:hypothetical protein